ncbi:MAG: hypothetical protein U0992_16110 [Planctomycetaceae bacterium]
MSFGSTVVLYLMLGAGAAGALFVREGLRDAAALFRLAAACLFWPLYVPVLLAPKSPLLTVADATGQLEAEQSPRDPVRAEIARVEAELDGALRTLDGWTEDALPLDGARFDELKQAWRLQAGRIRELGELLESVTQETQSMPNESSTEPVDRRHQSERARRDNVERLSDVHRRMQDDLFGNLAWVRELVTLIHLAKYTGAPASRAEELVAQIAAAVEGLSEVSDWRTSELAAAESHAGRTVTTAAD